MNTILKLIYSVFAVVALAIAALTANGAPGDLFASINGGPGNGVGFIYKYTSAGVQSTFASGLNRPRGLAFDSAGNLFVVTTFADATFHSAILKFTPDGTQHVFAVIPASFFGQGVAIDSSDNVFVMTSHSSFQLSIIYKFSPDGAGIPFAILPDHPSQGFDLAFDSTDNLFATDAIAQRIYKFAPDSPRNTFVGPEAFSEGGPIGLAFDAFGNLFVSAAESTSRGVILKFTPDGAESTFATGLNNPRGLVFDSAGNLFVAEIPFFATGDILKFAPDGTRTVFASGIGVPQGFGGPEFLAIQPELMR